MYRLSEKHISKAPLSFHERLKNALESYGSISVKVNTDSMLKKKYKRYRKFKELGTEAT